MGNVDKRNNNSNHEENEQREAEEERKARARAKCYFISFDWIKYDDQLESNPARLH